MFPIEIINKILGYVCELNNNIIMTQYDIITNKEYYKINFNSDLLWKIRTNVIMKRIYPIYSCDFYNKGNIELYRYGMSYYEKQLRLNNKVCEL